MADFKIGDVVVLKSGSPKMTITSQQTGSVTCMYYSHSSDNFKTEYFSPEIVDFPDSDEYDFNIEE